MQKLEDIGFYTLSDKRALSATSLSQMKRAEMIINKECNFKCGYCKKNDDLRTLSFEEIKENINQWCEGDAGPLENIRFSGGEPCLHSQLPNAIKYAQAKGVKRIAVSTNGSLALSVYQELINCGVNDFSISLDAADAPIGDMMAGGIEGSWLRVVENIRYIASQVYTTVGVVLTPDNIDSFIDIVMFAHSLGVADIRVIPSAQWNKALPRLGSLPMWLLDKHPILKYRVNNFIQGIPVRRLTNESPSKCPLVLDDSVIAGDSHYPCVIYMRERGKPIGKVSKNMRKERAEWFAKTDTHLDPICAGNCLDVCVAYNAKAMEKVLI